MTRSCGSCAKWGRSRPAVSFWQVGDIGDLPHIRYNSARPEVARSMFADSPDPTYEYE